MDRDDAVKDLIITGVKFTDRELGRGSYGTVFAVDYNGVMRVLPKNFILYWTVRTEMNLKGELNNSCRSVSNTVNCIIQT